MLYSYSEKHLLGYPVLCWKNPQAVGLPRKLLLSGESYFRKYGVSALAL